MTVKKTISLILAAVCAASALASCGTLGERVVEGADPCRSSSSGYADGAWLEARLGGMPDNVTVGTADSLGIDMTSFESDGYFIRTSGGETVIAGKTSDGLDRAVRYFAKAAEAGKPVGDAVYHEGYRIDRLTVAGNDISEYRIVYEGGTDSPSQEHNNAYFAAKEMKRLIAKACGAELEIVPDDCDKMIKIGYLDDGRHGENGFVYRVEGGNIYINGVGKANGCAAGVYFLLQEECAWDELVYGDANLRESDHVDIPEGTGADVDPMFDYANPYGVNRRPMKLDHSLYCGYVGNCCHGQQTYKWGQYDVSQTQICYTDEGIFNDIAEDILFTLENKRDAGSDTRSVDISQGDNTAFCFCIECRKVFKEENESNSGAIVRFANKLCEYIGDEFPETKVGIFAYCGTNIPSKTVPHENVNITFCTDHCCGYHYFDGEDGCTAEYTFGGVLGGGKSFGNRDFGSWLRGWCAMSDSVYVWHYTLDQYGHQITYDHNFYHDYMFFKECGVKGMFLEGDWNGLGGGRLCFKEMMYLQYHPDATEEEYDAAVSDMYDREYGDGGQYILAYTKNIWSKVQLAAGCEGCWYWNIIAPFQNDYELFCATEEEAMEMLDLSIDMTDSLEQEKAAKVFSTDLVYKRCWYHYFQAYDAGDTAELQRLSDLYDLFIRRLEEGGQPLHYRFLNPYYNENDMQTNLDDAAWIDWREFREELWDPDAEHKPMPEKYEGTKASFRIYPPCHVYYDGKPRKADPDAK